MLREKLLSESANLDIIASEAAEILDKYRRRFAEFKLGYHVLEARPVHCDAGDAVVEKMNQVCVAFFPGDLGEQLFLKSDLSRVFSP